MGKRPLFLLHAPDEMRHPYEAALAQLNSKLFWFSTVADMLEAERKEEPQVVVVDVDSLPIPPDSTLEQLRTAFSESDLIALSSSDSAQLAMHCLRLGFLDFLIKPASPEELAWSVRKLNQNRQVFDKLKQEKLDLVRAVTRIASVTTPALARLTVLELMQHWLMAEGAAWVQSETNIIAGSQVLASIPKRTNPAQILADFPWNLKKKSKAIGVRNNRTGLGKIYLPCKDRLEEGICIWGIPRKITKKNLATCSLFLEQGELSLHNIRKYEHIKRQTFVDDLTGLYNSRYLKFALTNAVLRSKHRRKHFAVLFIDVDHFKKINDTHGHLVGSEFLVAIGKTIRHAVRNIDPVFRYGGDEFVVLLHDTTSSGAMDIAERIRKNIERRVFVIQRQRIQTTVSIGIASFPDHATDKESLLKLADEAMYAAKKGARNCVHLTTSVPQKTAKEQDKGLS